MNKKTATAFAILAAALYAINIPFSKLLLQQVQPTMMAAFLYLGAGFGLYLYGLITGEREKGDPLTQKELPYTIAMIVLDIAAPILLMLGERPAMQFYLGLAVMIVATVLLIRDTISLQHTHEHSHGDLVHTHTHTHGADESVHDHRHLNIV